jgi:eukaryotic-like serine/threonine-protein kinase
MFMSTMTAERFAQRAFEVGLIDNRQLDSVWAELGTREVPLEVIISAMVRRELLTNFQAERILRGERIGYFYGKYKVLYLIGAGTFARVYRAVNIDTKRVVAVKVLRKRHRDNPTEYEQFLREGRMGSELRHVNIVPIYEVNGDPRAPYMVMEFVEGQTLREMMKVRKKLDVKTTLKIMADVVNGLAYAAEKGITHRDIKLSNVLVSSTGRAKLVDFGLAAAARGINDKELADCPNARAIDYAALERGTGVRRDDSRSDLFFLGCILYHVLSGRAPLSDSKDRLQRLNVSRFREIPSLNSVEPGLPHFVVAIVNRAMEVDPSKRYQSAAEMLREIQNAQQRLQLMGDEVSAEVTDGGESGDKGETDAALVGTEVDAGNGSATVGEQAVDEVLEGESRTVLVVESSAAMQDLFRDRLKRRGYRVLIISDPERARARIEADAALADCVIFSASELEEQAVEAFNRLAEDPATSAIPAILTLDPKQRQLAPGAQASAHRVVLVGPKLGELRGTLVRLIHQPSATQP